MMYCEFIKGTGCRDNVKNYEVFKNLEIMYMNSDMTKEEIYEYGKKLVDNSKSEELIRLEREVNEEINDLKDEIKWYRSKIQMYKDFINHTHCSLDKEKQYKEWIRHYKDAIKKNKTKISELMWVLE